MTMKKTYIIPEFELMEAHTEQMLAVSGVKSINNDVNIGYGGVDAEGDLEADTKANPHGESIFD